MLIDRLASGILATLLLGAPAAAHAKKPLTAMALQWSPTSELSEFGEVDLTGIGALELQLGSFDDERDVRDRVGENREDDARVMMVSTPDDVAAFVRQGLQATIGRVGLRTVETDGDVVLSGAVRRFFVTERQTYVGEVAIWLVARSRAGEVLWEGLANGSATRFGRSYKAENYNEVFSDSVMGAAMALLQNKSFAAVLREQGPAAE